MIRSFIYRALSWVQNKVSKKLQNALLKVLASGPIPQHVAFVMDGNRRYARRRHQAVFQGHAQGFEALRRVLEICMRLNVRCVTVYAFAIENFKRSPEEVDALMELAEEKLAEISRHGDLLDQYGVRLNVLGKKELLPASVQAAVRKAEEMTAKNNKAMLNLCMPYASRDDMTSAIEASVREALQEDSDVITITEEDVEVHIMTSVVGSPPLDILVRTSGVKRLSDFLLWQGCEDTQIQFTSVYWPDFGLLDFMPLLLDYQRKIWSSA
ncbi:hypothetical protein NM688_g7695 [Phlebia brevispora]|uniref:Uncharacterized protein n=1 Tax=Phlebia brevispora TaxID=194682 RepID=A0ACC1S244_9APHY|nr:hypothetical protein NM688_g7695 [Phlebia brevispora]